MEFLSQQAYSLLLVALILYLRIKRSIGFQPYKPRRLIFRSIIFLLLALFAISNSFLHPITFVYLLIGVSFGAVLLTYAIKHSHFEFRNEGLFYRTHIWIESIVLFLFLSRFLFRMSILFQISSANMNNLQYSQHFTKDPLTMVVLGILIVYYVGFYLFILRKGRLIQSQHSQSTLL